MFNPFDTKTTKTLTAAVEAAQDAWAETETDYAGMSFNAGHSARYGRPVAYCATQSKVIAFVMDNKFAAIHSTTRGMSAGGKARQQYFAGIAIHEIGHVVQYHAKVKPWREMNLGPAGQSAHNDDAWKWVCLTAWQKIGGFEGVSERTIRIAFTIDPDGAHAALQVFDPYRLPTLFSRKGLIALLRQRREDRACECAHCGETFYQRGTGRTGMYCAPRCKTAAFRAKKAA